MESSFRFSPLRQAHERIAKEKAEAKAPKEVKERRLERRDAEQATRSGDASAAEKRSTTEKPDRPNASLQARSYMQPTPTGTTMHVAWMKAVNARLAQERIEEKRDQAAIEKKLEALKKPKPDRGQESEAGD